MSLLHEIQNDAVSASVELATVLRKCRLLAARLDSEPLEQWIQWESGGYPIEADLPKYRVFRTRILGHFSGPFGSYLNNAEIPARAIPADIRQRCTHYRAHESIHQIEELLGRSDSGNLQAPIPADLVTEFAENVYVDMVCLRAWRETPRGKLCEIVNTVRNRILDFALRLEKIMPAAGEAAKSADRVEANAVNQVFNTTILGGSANIVGYASTATLQAESITPGDLDALRSVLEMLDVSADDATELESAIEDDIVPTKDGKIPSKAAKWLGKMVTKAASGLWDVGAKSVADVLTKALSSYYGIG